MLSADVDVTVADITSYELFAVGVPTITYTITDNQKRNAESFHKDGLMEYVGDIRCNYIFESVLELLQGKYQDVVYRKMITKVMKDKVDGKGAMRIAEIICR